MRAMEHQGVAAVAMEKDGGEAGGAGGGPLARARRASGRGAGSTRVVALVAVLCLGVGGMVGHQLARVGAERALATQRLEAAQEREEASRRAIVSLRGDLLTVLRESVDAEAFARPLDEVQLALDEIAAMLMAGAQGPRAAEQEATRALVASGAMAAPAQQLLPRWTHFLVGNSGDPRVPIVVMRDAAVRLHELRRTLGRVAEDRRAARTTLHALERAAASADAPTAERRPHRADAHH